MTRRATTQKFVTVTMQGMGEAVDRQFREIAKRKLSEAIRENNPSAVLVSVDGVFGAPLAGAKEYVHARFFYLRRVAEDALSILRAFSPVYSGKYKQSHEIYVDGVLSSLDGIGTATEIIVTNDLYYARVIEIGKGDKKIWSKQPNVPRDGIYRNAEVALQRRHGAVANISFIWASFEGGAAIKDERETQSEYRFPAIRIEAR